MSLHTDISGNTCPNFTNSTLAHLAFGGTVVHNNSRFCGRLLYFLTTGSMAAWCYGSSFAMCFQTNTPAVWYCLRPVIDTPFMQRLPGQSRQCTISLFYYAVSFTWIICRPQGDPKIGLTHPDK